MLIDLSEGMQIHPFEYPGTLAIRNVVQDGHEDECGTFSGSHRFKQSEMNMRVKSIYKEDCGIKYAVTGILDVAQRSVEKGNEDRYYYVSKNWYDGLYVHYVVPTEICLVHGGGCGPGCIKDNEYWYVSINGVLVFIDDYKPGSCK